MHGKGEALLELDGKAHAAYAAGSAVGVLLSPIVLSLCIFEELVPQFLAFFCISNGVLNSLLNVIRQLDAISWSIEATLFLNELFALAFDTVGFDPEHYICLTLAYDSVGTVDLLLRLRLLEALVVLDHRHDTVMFFGFAFHVVSCEAIELFQVAFLIHLVSFGNLLIGL